MAAIALGLLGAAPSIISGIAATVHAFEALFGHGHGSAKKQAVLTAVTSAAQVYDQVAGVAAPTFPQLNDAAIAEVLGRLIDDIVALYNGTGVFTHGPASASK